jgi:glycosyltransferase involved in cell wall biosynthesis
MSPQLAGEDPPPHRTRVLQLVLGLGLGGAESVVALLALHLDRARFDVEVWALSDGGPNVARLRDAGITVRVLGKGLGFDAAFLRKFRRSLLEGRFDLVHAHNSPAARWAAAGTLGRARRPRLIRTEHTYNARKRWSYAIGHTLGGGLFDRVIGVSKDTTEAHRRLDPLWRRRYVTIPNGIERNGGSEVPEADLALRDLLGVPRDGRLIVSLGNLRAPKGQSFLIEAFAQVSRDHLDIRLAVLGEGELRLELEQMAQARGLSDRIHLIGHREDAAHHLQAGDIYVQSSTREGFPVSILEAARACRPIVATDVGGTREIIEDGNTGLLVPPASPGALASAIDRLLRDQELAGRLAKSARRLFLERYTIDAAAAANGALYDDVVSRARPPSRTSLYFA